jgi:primary-amine oxidase
MDIQNFTNPDVITQSAKHRYSHPLDPLSADEIRLARSIVQQLPELSGDTYFPAIRLFEPPKQIVRDFSAGQAFERRAWVVAHDFTTHELCDGVVSLDRREVLEWNARPGLQGPLLLQEYDAAIELIKLDPRWQDAIRRRGIDDLDTVRVDAWMIGNFGIPEHEGRRLCASLAYLRDQTPDLPYARPIEGVVAYVDLDAREVIEVLDPDPVPVPVDPGRYDPGAVGPLRADLRPIEITQPEGVSFEVRGHEIAWQRWRFRWSFNAREGLVLHTIGLEDDGELRPIAHRISVSEMVVPYGDPSPAHYWQGAFDVGDFGIGRAANSLELNCDCLGVIQYFDVTIHDDRGEPVIIPRVICLHEEDYSILWKHWDFIDDHTQVRRQRRLVLSYIGTNLNYEYGYYWYFYLDGTLEFEVKLTGVMQTKGLAPGREDRYSAVVAPGVGAIHHQHLFNVRMNMEVDGPANTVHEVDLVAAPDSRENPWGNAMVMKVTPLLRESNARRSIDARAGRSWVVTSANRQNALGQPTGYQLIPQGSPLLLAPPGTSLGKRAAFARHHLWVTPFHPDERHAGGEYPNQHHGGLGLPAWTAADRPLDGEDLVLWHTFGLSHIARPEDWPVMPVEHCGFRLRPWGFFDRNPTLDVPPTAAGHCQSDR